MDSEADDIVFKPAWRLADPKITSDVRRLWASANIPSPLTTQRESEICAVAYSGDDIVAVSTASIVHDPGMRNNFFGYRCMVAPQIRQKNMAWRITEYSLKLLQEWNAKHAQKALGLMICVETDKFEAGLRKPVREKFGMAMHFIGYSNAGQQLRVIWFDDATLDGGAVKP